MPPIRSWGSLQNAARAPTSARAFRCWNMHCRPPISRSAPRRRRPWWWPRCCMMSGISSRKFPMIWRTGSKTRATRKSALGGSPRAFPASVSEPVRLHVPAKRYLCATNTHYFSKLSAASVVTLKLQGGPMTAFEIARFESEPYYKDAVKVRCWDDQGKVAGLVTPALAAYGPMIEALIAAANRPTSTENRNSDGRAATPPRPAVRARPAPRDSSPAAHTASDPSSAAPRRA